MQNKLIIVSYRLPYRFTITDGKLKITSSAGGLATALTSYFGKARHEKDFGTCHWVGVSDLSKRTFERVSSDTILKEKNFILHPIFLESRESDLFYNGFCNSVLWPLFHYFPSYVVYEEKYYEAYVRANQSVCDEI